MKNRDILYKEVFNSPSGQKVFEDLAKFCGAVSTSHCPGDALETAYREGMRRVFLRINSFTNKDFSELTKIVNTKDYR